MRVSFCGHGLFQVLGCVVAKSGIIDWLVKKWLVVRKIVERLVRAGCLLDDLHQHVVGQLTGAKAEHVIVHPVLAQCFLQHHQVVDGEFRSRNAAGRLHADLLPGSEISRGSLEA